MSAADVARDANIPDIIEEKRKDAVEGKVTQTKYVRGKLLGKVTFIESNGYVHVLFHMHVLLQPLTTIPPYRRAVSQNVSSQ
jgi:hypothetical protein